MDYTPSTEAWVKLPLELLKRRGISRQAAVLLAVIIDECKHKCDLSAPITADNLTERSSMSRRTLYRILKELRELDLIRVQRTGRSSIYTLTPGCVELCPRAVRDDRPAEQQPKKARSRKPTKAEIEDMAEYMQLVNRFKEDEVNEKKDIH